MTVWKYRDRTWNGRPCRMHGGLTQKRTAQQRALDRYKANMEKVVARIRAEAGDVPGYYVVTNPVNGEGGQYLAAESRWNKIDANHSLLDANGHISASGAIGQEPSVILINYGTNDSLWKQDASDVQASMSQCLFALRKAAPSANIFILIPFGQYKAAELYQAVTAFKKARPDERRLTVIDLGQDAARALTVKKGYWGGLHPNPRAHATFAAKIVAQLMATLSGVAEDR